MKVELADQIAEVEREIRQRQRRYPDAVMHGRLKPETAGRKVLHLQAAAITLRWLAANMDWIRPIAEERRRQANAVALGFDPVEPGRVEDHPAVAAVLDQFPGAQIVGVRDVDASDMEAASC